VISVKVLYIKHFATFIFAFLVFGSMILAMPTRGKVPDGVEIGRIYQALPRHPVPKIKVQRQNVHCSLSHSRKQRVKSEPWFIATWTTPHGCS
jgi:hypothetical protein